MKKKLCLSMLFFLLAFSVVRGLFAGPFISGSGGGGSTPGGSATQVQYHDGGTPAGLAGNAGMTYTPTTLTLSGDISVGNDVLLADGGTVGITSNELLTWNAAGTITVGGADLLIANGNGQVLGHTAQLTVGGVTGEFQMLGTAAADSTISLGQWSAATTAPIITFYKSRNTTIGSYTAVTSGDDLGSIIAYGDDGTDDDTESSKILFDSEGTIGTGRVPGIITFSTATDAATSTLTEALRITSGQRVGIGNTAPAQPLEVGTDPTDGNVEVNGSLWAGRMELTEDGGLVTAINMPVSATPAPGTVEGINFSIDGTEVMTLYTTADSAGQVYTPRVGINTTAPTATLHVLNEDNNANVTIFNLEGKRSTPTNNDTMYIYYRMNNDNSDSYEYARTTITAEDITDGSEVGSLLFEVSRGGSLETALKMSADIIVLNESGADRDFRVESDTVVNAIFLDGATGGVGIGLEPTANMLGLAVETGLLTLKETTTPTADANYGKIYTKSDNLLYFQDGAGVEHALAEFDTDYAEMYLNANANVTTIETANTPIALRQFTTGSLDGWTFDAGSTGAITAYADAGAGQITVTSNGHGLATGDVVSIRGTTNYNGIFVIANALTNTFEITDTWVADDGASDWDEPSNLVAGAAAAGVYDIAWNMSSSEQGGAGSTVTFAAYINGTAQNNTRIQRKFANNDVGAFGGRGILTISASDIVFITASSSGVNTITNSYGSVVLMRL
jgi:hypothetical protein